jgi:hypothetical protein
LVLVITTPVERYRTYTMAKKEESIASARAIETREATPEHPNSGKRERGKERYIGILCHSSCPIEEQIITHKNRGTIE